MLIKMKISPTMQFESESEIIINSEAIGAFMPIIEVGAVSGKPHIACYSVHFILGLSLQNYFNYSGSESMPTVFYISVEEEEKIEKLLKPRCGLNPSLRA